jgi:hypothetical protein
MLVVKPSEWPSLATKAGRFIRLCRVRLAPILLEVKDISRSIMEEGRPAEPDEWIPLPQPYQKGGEFPMVQNVRLEKE